MKNFLKVISAAFASLALAFVFSASVNMAYADSVQDCAALATPEERALCASQLTNPDPEQRDLMSTVRSIINTVLTIIGVLCACMIIYGGVTYITSQGDPGKMTKAKGTIMYAIIGVVICLIAFAIVNFVLSMLAN